MKIIQKGLSTLLIICMMFSLMPVGLLPEVDAVGSGASVVGTSKSLSNRGTVNAEGGTLDVDEPVFRVSLSRSKDNYLNGTEERKNEVIKNYQNKYPTEADYSATTLFLWPKTAFNKALKKNYNGGVISMGKYENTGTGLISWYSDLKHSTLNICLKGGGSSVNTFKTKVLAAYNAKTIQDIGSLSNQGWKNYLPTFTEAENLVNYVFARVGNGYKIDERIKEVVSSYMNKDPKELTELQKMDVSAGYGGLLASLYVLSAANENRIAVTSTYAVALDDYFGSNNVEEKPVSLVIDTCISMTLDGPDEKAVFALPSIDYIEYSLVSNTNFSITEGNEFITLMYPESAGNTRNMVKAMADESTKVYPRSQTYATKRTSGVIRFADTGGWMKRDDMLHRAFGWAYNVPQFNHAAIRINSNNKSYWNPTDKEGFMDLLTFDNNIKGFIIVGGHISNPIPKISFSVEDTVKLSGDVCSKEVHAENPVQIVLKFVGDSSLISSLQARKNDPNFTIKLKPTIFRTEKINSTVNGKEGSTIEPKTQKAILEAQIPATLTADQMIEYLQGKPMMIYDTEIMNKTYIKSESGDKSIIYIYEIDLDITIDKTEYKNKSENIVIRNSEGKPCNFAELNIPTYSEDVTPPEDIVITKPTSTMTTDVINPSENENLSELTQMVKRYEFTSSGAEFAEVKHNEPLKEKYEVMGGVPSSEELYFSVGGSEYKVALIMQYWMNEHSRDRTYTIHFDGVKCEYNNETEGKGDRMPLKHPVAQPGDVGKYTDKDIHCLNEAGTGGFDGTIVAEWDGAHSHKTEWSSGCHVSKLSGKCVLDTSKFDSAKAAAETLASELRAEIVSWTSSSDALLREVTWTPVITIEDDRQDTHSDGKSCRDNCTKTGCTHISGSNGSDCSNSHKWHITLTATIPDHAVCGPCCGHHLPDLYDTWRQGLVYDFVKISQIRLYVLDQGSAEGFKELTGVDKVFANVVSGNPTYFMNIAQLTEKERPTKLAVEGKEVSNGGLTVSLMEKGGITMWSGDNRRASQSSRDGRLRYILADGQTTQTVSYSEQGDGTGGSYNFDPNLVAAPMQHDDVIYTVGVRSKNCDGMATDSNFGKHGTTVNGSKKTGHDNEWADGCLYSNIQNTTDYSNYWSLSSYGNSYSPKELKANDNDAMGLNGTFYYEDYNHHIQRNGLTDKKAYSDKADQKDILTPEWKVFDKARRTKIIVNVISDFLILQTSGGDQSIFYYEKASPATEAQEHFQKVKIPEDEIFTNNPLSIFKSAATCKGKKIKYDRAEDSIVVGGYNGRYDKPADKYKPYSLIKKEFLPFAGAGTVYDANKHQGTYQYWGGSQVKTILDEDPAKTISRPVRQATSQDTSFKILQKNMRILPTTANQLYEPQNSMVWYSQVVGFYSSDERVIDLETPEASRVGCKSNVLIGWPQRIEYSQEYKQKWGNFFGVDNNTKYFRTDKEDDNTNQINGVVVYTPVSTEDAMVLQQGDLNIEGTMVSRDQRTNEFDFPDMNDLVNKLKVCPLDPALCEYRYLDCKYLEPTILADFDFSDTYNKEEKNFVDGNYVTQNVTKKNTYYENGKWITTNKITGIEYVLPSGFSIESSGRVGSGKYLVANGTRWSIPFGDLGLSNSKANRIQVEMDLTVNSTQDNLMLVSFQNYGFIITPRNTLGSFVNRSNLDKNQIGVRKDISVATSLNNVHLTLIYSFNNVIDCEVSVNGVPANVSVVSELRKNWETVNGVRTLKSKQMVLNDLTNDSPENLARADVGNNINIGSWGSSDAYRANYYLDNLKIILMGGTNEHNSTCYEKITVHATKMVHVHNDSCYAKEDIWTCDGEPNVNYQLGCNNRPLNAHVHDSSCTQYYNSSISENTVYNVAAGTTINWGSNGHTSASHDWPIITINGSQYGSSYSGSYYFSSAGTVSWYTQTPCRGGSWCTITGYINKCSGVLNTHVHTGTAGLNYANGCYTKPTQHIHNASIKVLNCTNPVLNAGGTSRTLYVYQHQSGCTYAGSTHYSTSSSSCSCDHSSCVPRYSSTTTLSAGYCVWLHSNTQSMHISSTSDRCSVCGSTQGSVTISSNYTRHEHTNACYTMKTTTCTKIPKGSLICNGEPNTLSDFNAHVHNASCLTTYSNLSAKTFQYIGESQTYIVPWTDYYTIEVYGPSSANKAGYASGRIKLKAGTKLYINVGSQSGYNGKISDVRLKALPNGIIANGEEGIRNEQIKDSENSRLMYAGTTQSTVVINNLNGYTFTNQQKLLKGNDGNGRVIITPANTNPQPTIYQQIINGTMKPEDAKQYLGDELFNTIMQGQERLLHTWSGWSSSNDKGFGSASQCTLTMNGNLVVKSTGTDPIFRVNLDNIPANAITKIKVYLNNNPSNRGQIFLTDATGYENEADSIWSNTITANANNQVMTFDVVTNKNLTGNLTKLRFDLMSATGTATVTKIEVYGYGSKVSGSGEASYVNTEKVVASKGTTWSFSYKGSTESKTLEKGKYKLEVWGAQGGKSNHGISGGYGGYATGTLTLSTSTTIYVGVGGMGGSYTGGFNGGGTGSTTNNDSAAGGGATHIASRNGVLSSLSSYKSSVYIVAGGGGASGCSNTYGGAGGGETAGYADDPNTGYGGAGGPGTQYSGGIGGTNSQSGSFGKGGNTGTSQAWPGGGGGGGWYGGGAGGNMSGGGGAGGGGSGYVGGVQNGSMQTGIQSGNGKALITALEDIKTSSITYSFTPLKITYTSPLKGSGQIILDNISKIPDKINGDYNPIWACKFAEFNTHVCESTDGIKLCKTYTYLNCTEPHHRGEHYSSSNKICWSACGKDDNHKNTKTETKNKEGTETLHLAEYLQLDAAFTVYFPNIGNFYGNGKLGLASPQTTRGFGYTENMDTTNWTREKRVKFPFDVIFEDNIYTSGTWIDLDVPTEYFNFYLLVSNSEMANAPVEFEVEAINCNTGVGVNVNPSTTYSSMISTEYAKTLDNFLKNYLNVMLNEIRQGYQMPLAKAKGANTAAPIPFGKSGYENFYIAKETKEEKKLRDTMVKINQQIEKDFEGNGANGAINPHTGSTTGINYKVKPMTSNDNYIRVDNKLRQDSFHSLHGGYKKFYLDVIGRIGNFALVDTEDFRFSNFFKMPIVTAGDEEGLADPNNWLVEGLVLKVDDSIQNLYVGDTYDLRGNKASPDTHWLDTYGTETWMAGKLNGDGRDINNPNLVSQILSGDINNIDVLKVEELRFGYDAYTSLVTFGSYEGGQVQVVPKYFALKLTNNDLKDVPDKYNVPKGTYIPLDVYIDKDGLYSPVNIYGNAGNGQTNKGNFDLYDYVFNLDWTDESARRNYTLEEKARTLRVCEYYKNIVYEYPEGEYDPDINIEDLPIADVIKLVNPEGKNNLLGTSQYILMDSKHRTFIGDRNSYGNNVYRSQAGTTDFGSDKNKNDALNDIFFQRAVQRWHGKLGIPSSSVFVPTGVDVTTDSIKYVMNDDFAILCTAETIAIGDVWSLYYSQPWFDTLKINGDTFSTSKHYPGHRITDGNGNSVECPDCLPPIVAVYSSNNSSIEDVEIINTH